MRVEFVVRGVVAVDTMSVSNGDVREGDSKCRRWMSSVTAWCHSPMASSRDEVQRAMLSFLSRPAEREMQVDGVSFRLRGDIDAPDFKNKASTDNARVNAA